MATILIGGNDFLDLLEAAALDPSTDAATLTALGTTGQTVVTNIEAAVDTILAASPTVRVVISTLPPVSRLPAIADAAAGRDRPRRHRGRPPWSPPPTRPRCR